MLTTIVGSTGMGKYLEGAKPVLKEFVAALGALNNPLTRGSIKGALNLMPYMRVIDGLNGEIEGIRNKRLFAQDDGDNSDSLTYQENFGQWSYLRQGFLLKDYDFNSQLIEDAYESSNLDKLDKIAMEKINDMRVFYLEDFLPNRIWETVFKVRASGTTFYNDSTPIGFLRNTTIDSHMLKPAYSDNLLRNHYWGVEDSASGTQSSDLDAVVEYLYAYKGVNESDIYIHATPTSINAIERSLGIEAKSNFSVEMNLTMDGVGKAYQMPIKEINGLKFVPNDYIGRGLLLFLVKSSAKVITKLQSPKADRRGVGLIKENDTFKSLKDVRDLMGSFFKIFPESYNITEPHLGLILDMDNDGAVDTRFAEAATFTKIENHRQLLKGRWYKGLRI